MKEERKKSKKGGKRKRERRERGGETLRKGEKQNKKHAKSFFRVSKSVCVRSSSQVISIVIC